MSANDLAKVTDLNDKAREWFRTAPMVTEIIAAKNHGSMRGKSDPGFNATEVMEICADFASQILQQANERIAELEREATQAVEVLASKVGRYMCDELTAEKGWKCSLDLDAIQETLDDAQTHDKPGELPASVGVWLMNISPKLLRYARSLRKRIDAFRNSTTESLVERAEAAERSLEEAQAQLKALEIMLTATSWGAALGAVTEDYPKLGEMVDGFSARAVQAERGRCLGVVEDFCGNDITPPRDEFNRVERLTARRITAAIAAHPSEHK